ncbi:MAG: hypothetical protein V3V08_15065 [Nannocystaceae bacterium]
MPWLFSVLLAATARAPTVPATVAVLHEPAVSIYREVAREIRRTLTRRVIFVAPGQRWELPYPPQAVIALGDNADADAAGRWPDRARASLLMWRPAIPTRASSLFVSARVEPACTSRRLAEVPGSAPWLILASASDTVAARLAQSLDAQLIQGDAAEIQRRLRQISFEPGARIWLRNDPDLAVAIWLQYLGHMNRFPAITVGSDGRGLSRFGIQSWVQPNLSQLQEDAVDWVKRATRSRRVRRQTKPLRCR